MKLQSPSCALFQTLSVEILVDIVIHAEIRGMAMTFDECVQTHKDLIAV